MAQELQRDYNRLAARVVGAILAVAAVTFVCSRLVAVNPTTAGFFYLVTVLVVAAEWGLLESVVASILATLCFNFFFLPPVGAFTIADTENWVALIAFLVTSLIASQLSEKTKRRTIEAVNRQTEIERLYALSRAILLTETHQPIASQIARDIARIYEVPAVAIYDRSKLETYWAGPEDITDIHQKLHDAAVIGTSFHDERTAITVSSITLGGRPIGSLALKGASLPDTALRALSNLVGITLERVRGQELANRAEVARQSQEFKSTLLDALAHEFKTPLTSIKAAATAILSSDVATPGEQGDLLAVIDQEADRLGGLVSQAMQFAQIEAGKIEPRMQPFSIRELVETVVRQMESALEGRPVDLAIAPDLPRVLIDVELMRLALRQLIDNAVKYSPPGSQIRVAAKLSNNTAIITIRNQGPTLPDWEKSRIFDKFYRGADVRDRVPGTGMGLAIASEILRAHGGKITMESSPERGTEFFASVPVVRQETLP